MPEESHDIYAAATLKYSFKTRDVTILLPMTEQQTFYVTSKGAFYKIDWFDCNFLCYGQTERALSTRIRNRRGKVIRVGDNNSKNVQEAKQVGHDKDS